MAWVAERPPDLVCVTGDLVSRRAGRARSSSGSSASLGTCYVVLGNHDFADSRDPLSQRIDPESLEGIDGPPLC